MTATTAPAAAAGQAGQATRPRRAVSPWNPANAVTASRYLTLPAIWWAVDRGYHQYATLFVIICGLLDKADGLVARLCDCRSPFGELFDAITDGICYGFGMILVAAYGWAPPLAVGVIIAFGLINTGFRFIYIRRAGRTVNYKSYAMERIVAYTGYLLGFATGGMEVRFFYWMFVPLMSVVVLHDARRMLVDPIRGRAGSHAMTLVSDPVFRWALSIATAGFAGVWTIHDLILLVRLRGKRRDPLAGDQRFGYVIGMAVGVIGIIGTLRFNGVL